MTVDSDSADDNVPTSTTDITSIEKYQVLPNYDKGFLEHGTVTTISALLDSKEEKDTTNLTVDSFKQHQNKKMRKGTPFICALILRITVPSTKPGELSFPAFKKNRFDKKAVNRATYKKCILVADLADPKQLTGVILEESNEDHNRLFQRDLSLDNVAVGAMCAIMTPRIEGHQLKNGAWVITTNRPLEFLSAPEVPLRPLRPEKIGHEIRYFVLTGRKIYLLEDNVVDPIKTKCNFHSCDRHNAKSLGNQSCGCWVQNRRSDNNSRNTVLLFSFYFADSNDKIVKSVDFTSLRTTKLFFKGKSVLAEADTLQVNTVYDYIQEQWRESVDFVNDNDGWTIVGWFIRATIDDEDKEEGDETLLRTNIKINVSYLYPTTKKGQAIPNEKLIDYSRVKELAEPTGPANA